MSSSSIERKNGCEMQWLGILKSRERKCVFSLDFCHSDRRFLTEQEAKLLYATRVTRGHRFGGVPTTPRGRDLFLLVLLFG